MTESTNGKGNTCPFIAIVVVDTGKKKSLLSFGPILISAQLEQQISIENVNRREIITCRILLDDHSPDRIFLYRNLFPNYSQHDTAIVRHNVHMIIHRVYALYEKRKFN